jgi:hypothetical protein
VCAWLARYPGAAWRALLTLDGTRREGPCDVEIVEEKGKAGQKRSELMFFKNKEVRKYYGRVIRRFDLVRRFDRPRARGAGASAGAGGATAGRGARGRL